MKNLTLSLFALFLFVNASHARSIRPLEPLRGEVAPVTVEIPVMSVGKTGEVLKENRMHPFTDYLISFPAEISTKSACTSFVGQQNTTNAGGTLPVITALGAIDPTQDACIEVMPMPVKTQLTVKMHVLTGGFVPAARIQSQLVLIQPLGLHKVVLDLDNLNVKLVPMRPIPR